MTSVLFNVCIQSNCPNCGHQNFVTRTVQSNDGEDRFFQDCNLHKCSKFYVVEYKYHFEVTLGEAKDLPRPDEDNPPRTGEKD